MKRLVIFVMLALVALVVLNMVIRGHACNSSCPKCTKPCTKWITIKSDEHTSHTCTNKHNWTA